MKNINDNLADFLYNYYKKNGEKSNNIDPWFDIFNLLDVRGDYGIYTLFGLHDYADQRDYEHIEKLSLLKFKKILNLKKINIGNSEYGEPTLIKDISPLKFLYFLEEIDISNTSISNLDPIWHLPNLKRILIENTQISQIGIVLFKIAHPNVEVVEQVYL